MANEGKENIGAETLCIVSETVSEQVPPNHSSIALAMSHELAFQ